MGEEVLSILGGEEQAESFWEDLKSLNGLQDLSFKQVFNADFMDKTFTPIWDTQFCTEKIEACGYPKHQIFEGGSPLSIITECIDKLKADKIVPHH
eukprot:CAMPEP_0204869314 /NCGR_PEP_ID=MMETSP1348-20121228/29247_1 /ASSEMBLY_ACC=CAM_ASM_000700 /TAXON_ID=215587 /ORGANISM="Aplanochytrium stocchinoi, Strain GSBS06" /LENGTH=95 /DNA_ID=CAMNT_0052022623 /DNA_START=159 /DNA_END=446 /DNA_ORIENTATION=+